MKQLLQSLKDGTARVEEVPAPRAGAGQVQIAAACTLISAGTERMLAEFGRSGWVARARAQPDKVREVVAKARTDGVAATFDAVRSKLDQPLAPGYCHVGRVTALGPGVEGLALGDRVVSNGRHAETVVVPRNLVACIPDGVPDEDAAFTVLAAIGLQGIRLAQPTLGECVVVTGLGLIGLLTVQLLRAQGCRVLGIDLDQSRCDLARRFGAETANPAAGEDVQAAALAFSRGAGVDAVLITASTRSSEPVSQAARMCRKRGRIVLVGVTGLELSRADFYEKELSFQVSCSYGPGRYDPAYEEGGQDYPLPFVRWTEGRNFEAVLDLMAAGRLDCAALLSHRFDIDHAEEAMALLTAPEPSLGILLRYPAPPEGPRPDGHRVALAPAPPPAKGSVVVLGAGNYASRTLLPAFRAAGAPMRTLASAGGVTAVHFGRRFGFAEATTDSAAALQDPAADTVVIATRHDAHAAQVLAALRAGKHVFCEKPLCLTQPELDAIEAEAAQRPDLHLMVGFNRRFAPQVLRMKALLAPVAEPKAFVVTVNAGAIPPDHWTQDPAQGGGRLLGEACHFIDLLRHLAGYPVADWQAMALGPHPALAVRDDKASLTLRFADGSVGTVHFLANGHKGFPKERIEVFAAGRVLQLDNFVSLRGWGWAGFSRLRLWRQDKGQRACVAAFVEAVRNGAPTPIPRDEVFESSRLSIAVAETLR